MTYIKNSLNKIHAFVPNTGLLGLAILIWPVAMISGPLLPEIILIISCLAYFFNGKNYCDKFFLKVISFFFISVLISTVISEYSYLEHNKSHNIIKSILHFRFLIFFLFLLFIFKNKKIQKFFSNILLFVIIFLFIDTLIQFIFGVDIFGNAKSSIGRLSGPYRNEFIIGGVMLKFYIIYFMLNYKKIFNSLNNIFLFIILTNISLFTIIISGERATFLLMLLFVIFLMVYYLFIHKRIFVYFLFSFIFITPLYFEVSGLMFARFTEVITEIKQYDKHILTTHKTEDKIKNSSSDYIESESTFLINRGYFAHYYSAFSIFKNHILFGVGQRNFRYACKDVRDYKETKELLDKYKLIDNNQFLTNLCTTHPHNIYMEILSEAGLFGSLIFISMVLILFLRIKKSKEYELFGPWLIIFFPVVPTGSFFNNFNSMFFFLIISIIYSQTAQQKKPQLFKLGL